MSPPRIIVCGSRDWYELHPIRTVIKRMVEVYGNDLEVVHGGCRGADAIAANACDAMGIAQRPELADWARSGKRAGPQRNRRMLALNPRAVVAFKRNLDRRLRKGGTEHMLRIALLAGVPCGRWSNGKYVSMSPRDVASKQPPAPTRQMHMFEVGA